nr:MAG TPA: hypothetical protein [Caudoviricetes sp.]
MGLNNLRGSSPFLIIVYFIQLDLSILVSRCLL